MVSRLEFIEVPVTRQEESLPAEVAIGLSQPQKTLPSRLFYDRRGSELFERITGLPEYYPTRTEQWILDCYASDILERVGDDLAMVEFGSGSSCKTRTLIEAALARQSSLVYVPIDISAEFLRASSQQLLHEYDRLQVKAVAAEYFDSMSKLPKHDGPRLFLFLGSNVGNFDREESVVFLRGIRRQMAPYDRLMMGVDLVKDVSVLEAAYNDSAGVTEAFNKNLLVRINNELGGHFDLELFDHWAPFVEEESRIEMRLVSRESQVVPIDGLDRAFSFREGEYIHTENSYKYTLSSVDELCEQAGMALMEDWKDPNGWFATVLIKPEDA